ncbi:hypothetical protein CFN78_10490 [Amycolatopsis antarctica]|uniref:HTH arsR-type domain-containing protein n=1 Tax=Amycolatopsis antarctica TaxID=1854586 RepID=A0A263D6S3_9PSEU|nr:hypothetical protein CFN78_10490 [Amycolatopsis antarctica]
MNAGDVSAAVQAFCRIVVKPDWDGLRKYLHAERDTRGRILTTGGVERLLSTLHPRVTWRSPVLEVPGAHGEDVHLNGRRLLLAPSFFMADRPAMFIENDQVNDQPMLIFSAQPELKTVTEMWGIRGRSGGDGALCALVGRTRAAVLNALSDSSTTGELAERLGISAAGVSQHTGVLRSAGLITTRRNRNSVMHSITPLGVSLISGGGPQSGLWQIEHVV